MALDVKNNLLSIYPTPVYNFHWNDTHDLNQALKDVVLQQESESQGLKRSNVGGWHSETGIFDSSHPCVKELRDRIGIHVAELFQAVSSDDRQRDKFNHPIIDGWANVLRFGQYNSLHSHPNAFWSGVYYIAGCPNSDVEDAHPFSGKLEFVDPRPGASLNYTEGTNLYGRFLVNPIPGQLLMFPGWLQHHVHPYFGESERISIAFNVTVNSN